MLQVLPLNETASGEVLDRQFPDLPTRLRRRILADAAGNPLALLDLPEVYRRESLSGVVPGFGSVRTRLEAAYSAQLASLPAPLRQVLLLLALAESHPGGAPVHEQSWSLSGDELTGLERSGLVSRGVFPDRWTLRHPLVRAALIRSASPVELRAAHALLARAQQDQPERRIWHLGAASTAPDEAAATEIEALAETVYGRGGSGVAALALRRAAELSADPHGGTRRMQRAAYMATESGDFELASLLLREVRLREAEPGHVLRDSLTRSLVLMFRDGDFAGVQEAAQHAAAHDVDDVSPEEREHLAQVLVHVAFFLGKSSAWDEVRRSIAQLTGPVGPDVDLSIDALTDQPGVQDRLRRRFETVTEHEPPLHLGYLYFAVMHRDLLYQHRHHIDQLVEREADAGALAYAALGYEYSARDGYLAGDWDRCEQLALAGLELATSNDLAVSVQGLRCVLGFLAASRGDDRQADSYGVAVERWATARQGGFHRAIAVHVRGLAALTRGDHEAAHQQLQRISPGGDLCIASLAQWPILDAVEAAVRSGRPEHARSLVQEADRRQVADLTPRLRVLVPAARAMAAADGAQDLFAAALQTPEIESFPFDRARIHLLAGESRRRHDTPAAARPDLRRAADLFTQLGATSWRGRAEQELRASGLGVGAGIPRPVRAPDGAQLTPQQREIAELAASGLSTKQIAQRLYLSPRTVSSHLYQIYPKLGIASRSALRDALTQTAEAPDQ
jgi:DNA-binding CsgD family transcriptional regulator